MNVFAIPLIVCYVVLYPISKLASGLSCIFLRLFGMKVNKDASDRSFGKVDQDYFVQSSIDNVESEEELDTEVNIVQNALDLTLRHILSAKRVPKVQQQSHANG